MTTQANAPTPFSRNLQRQRYQHSWTLRQAGDAAGVSWMTIRRADIAVSRAAALAAAYGTTVDALLCEATP